MNFGTERSTVTSVKEITQKIVSCWGKGKYKIINKKKFYEQTNLQLNINKSKKYLKWKPKFNINQCIYITVEWYRKVLQEKISVNKITKDQILDYMKLNDKKKN